MCESVACSINWVHVEDGSGCTVDLEVSHW